MSGKRVKETGGPDFLAVAASAINGGFDMPGFLEFLAHFLLVFAFGFGGPVEIGDLVHGAEVFFRSAVAVQTPAHALVLMMVNHGHFIDLAVATHAGNPCRNVSTVIKVSVVRSVVDFDPLDRFPSLNTLF